MIKVILAAKEETDAMQRTTTAITVFSSGYKVRCYTNGFKVRMATALCVVVVAV